MKEYQKTILIAVVIGIPLTSLIAAYSFWLAHNSVVLTYVLLPGAFMGSKLGLSGGSLWCVIIVVQVVCYLILAFAIKAATRRIMELTK